MGSTVGEDGFVVLDSLDETNSQAVRIAVTLSAITLKPVRIENIRRFSEQPGETSSRYQSRTVVQIPNILCLRFSHKRLHPCI